MKKLITIMLLCVVALASTGCLGTVETDRDRVASVALTYESVLDGLTTARKSGLLDDDAYRKIDPVVDTADAILKALKAQVDAGENVTDDSLDRANKILDALLDVLIQYNADQSRIDRVLDMKHELQRMRVV